MIPEEIARRFGDPAGRASVEQSVATLLKRVRFVFETGFPEDLVEEARQVVRIAELRQALRRGNRVTYPACVVLAVVAAARDYDGRSFWTSRPVEALGIPSQAVAGCTLTSFRQLGLDTFEEVVLMENALRLLTPVLMHAGFTGPENHPPCRTRGHRVAVVEHASEQIASWARAPRGSPGP